MQSRLQRHLQEWLDVTESALAVLDPTPGWIAEGETLLNARQRKLLIDLARDHRRMIRRELEVLES